MDKISVFDGMGKRIEDVVPFLALFYSGKVLIAGELLIDQ